MQALFTRPDAWSGGSYELALEYERLSDKRLRAVISRLWDHSTLLGCYLDLNAEPDQQPRVSPAEVEPWQCLRGVAALPNGERASCSSIVVREEEATWIYFGVPLGSLGSAYPVGAFPFADGTPLDWRAELDGWLLDMARFIFAEQPFRLGLVGWVDPLDTTAADLASTGVPEQRWEGYVVPVDDTLEWYPANQGAPFTTP